jgi:hypothetical protein
MRSVQAVVGLLAGIALLSGGALLVPEVQAQIDYRAPRDASRPWQRKLDEYNREAKQRSEGDKVADALWEAPVTPEELARARSSHQAEYEAKRQRFGNSYADNWLERQIRNERVIESLR